MAFLSVSLRVEAILDCQGRVNDLSGLLEESLETHLPDVGSEGANAAREPANAPKTSGN